jgi:hypothetical protein
LIVFKIVHKKISGVTLCTLATIKGKRGALLQPQGTPQIFYRYLLSLAMIVIFCVRCKLRVFFTYKKILFIFFIKKVAKR